MKARLPQGMGKGPGSQKDMLRQVQKMQQDIEAKQAELEAKEYDIAAGGGVCKIKINGKKEILSIELDPMIVDADDIENLQDILVAGVNEAIKRVDDTNNEEMSRLTGNAGIPGLF